ncbi:hypothetical protein WMY93_008664 [Mugilogobius chulae]|uniref:Cadherin domain-containing protein n=1 Tax=Mugilogobius chulae TaxID=88201 RepID=A0AAW0PVV0_9GOBI
MSLSDSEDSEMKNGFLAAIFPVALWQQKASSENHAMVSHTTVSIRILDVNDNPPELALPYEASICEDTKPGQATFTLAVPTSVKAKVRTSDQIQTREREYDKPKFEEKRERRSLKTTTFLVFCNPQEWARLIIWSKLLSISRAHTQVLGQVCKIEELTASCLMLKPPH